MFFKAWNPSCQSRIAVLNIRFSVSIVLLLLPRESRLSILFDVKSARGIQNFLTPRKEQKTSSCWCVMSVAKRSSNKKCYRVIDLAHIIGAVLHLLAVTSCGLSFPDADETERRFDVTTNTKSINLNSAGDKCEIRQVHYQTIDLNEDRRQMGRSWKDASLLKSLEMTS